MTTQQFDLEKFHKKTDVIDAILALGNVTPNTRDQVTYWERILKNGLEVLGAPTVFTRAIQSKSRKHFGKTLVVFLWKDGEMTMETYAQNAENAVRWFDGFMKAVRES